MDLKSEITKRLLHIRATDQEFQSEWQRYRPSHSATETYRLARDSYEARERAVSELFEILCPYYDGVVRGEGTAIDAVLDFLEIDIPAFRAGYAKEWYYRRLKRMQLTDSHKERIKKLGMALLKQPDYRREWKELARLLIRVADQDLVTCLAALVTSDSSPFVKRRASRILESILNERHDLRPATK